LGVEVAQWADEIDDLNETTSWRKALGEGSESDGFPKQNEGERFLYTFWPWPACLSQLDCSWIIDDVDSKLSLSSSVLKLEQWPSCTAAQPHSPSRARLQVSGCNPITLREWKMGLEKRDGVGLTTLLCRKSYS
jgi:hypothetical protein